MMRELDPRTDGGAMWVSWRGEGREVREITVRRFDYCGSDSPSGQGSCWLPDGHRGGHAWERFERRAAPSPPGVTC
ncbi:hypothetical protein E0L36_21280 [Streptomyces sp. AJS327]|uniref:hypothetical protein n=1 Tax=Streptomyces sp. AJS327 TaxID=2545265 RepID=UPI0015DE2A16|nr:hypothetical protein [Streptomyces sp. AJS327]MBA0053313.1 hypothetical protein [Streptomyces sp. AJS327]